MEAIGIDVGGSGIKGARIDVRTGRLIGERIRYKTPRPAHPHAVIERIEKIVREVGGRDPLGVGLPSIVTDGVVQTATNVDGAWIGFPARERIAEALGRPTSILNDADAAGLAEVRFGAARGCRGVVIVLTLGTGIGSAVFVDGRLVPNTELGHLHLAGQRRIVERYASDRARSDDKLGWKKWAARLDEYLLHLERLFSPELIVLGGGVSQRHEKFVLRLGVRTPVVPAALRNHAGIVGAAMAAAEITFVAPPRLG